jgi:hypothetical protein
VVVAEEVKTLQAVEIMVLLEDQAVEQDMDLVRQVQEILLLSVLLKVKMVELLLLRQDLLQVVVELVQLVLMVHRVQVTLQDLNQAEMVEMVWHQKLQLVLFLIQEVVEVVDMLAQMVLVEQVAVELQEILQPTEQITLVVEVVVALIQQVAQAVLEDRV